MSRLMLRARRPHEKSSATIRRSPCAEPPLGFPQRYSAVERVRLKRSGGFASKRSLRSRRSGLFEMQIVRIELAYFCQP
jgi:hypothetical protein